MTNPSIPVSPGLRARRLHSRTLPYLALAVGVVALGFSALFVRWANAPGPVTGLYRMAIASAVMAPFALVRRPGGAPWPAAGIGLALLGGLSLSLDLALWTTAVNITTAAGATLLANTAPLWVALAAWLLFHERLTGRFWLGLLITLGGATTVLGGDFLLHPTLGWGDLMSLGAGVFYGGYYLCTQQGRRWLAPLPYVWLAGLASTASLLAISLVLRQPLTGYSTQTYAAFLGLALVTQVIGYLAVSYSLGHLPAATVSPTMVGQPVLTAVLAVPFLGEVPSLAQIVGGIAVLVGIVLIHRSRNHPDGAAPG